MPNGTAVRRKKMAAVGRLEAPAGDDWIENGRQLIGKAKALMPFGDVEWDAPVWDVSAAYEHRTRGYKANARGLRLPFTQHRQAGKGVGDPLPEGFADVVKALVCMRHQRRGQSMASHSVFIRAARNICDAIRGDRKSTRLNSSHVRISYAVFCLKKKTKNINLIYGFKMWHCRSAECENIDSL